MPPFLALTFSLGHFTLKVSPSSSAFLKSASTNLLTTALRVVWIFDTVVPSFNTLYAFYIPSKIGIPHFVSHVAQGVIPKRFTVTMKRKQDCRAEVFRLAKRLDWTLWELHEVKPSLQSIFQGLTASETVLEQ